MTYGVLPALYRMFSNFLYPEIKLPARKD